MQKKGTRLLFYNKFSIFLNKKTPHSNPLSASGERGLEGIPLFILRKNCDIFLKII
jgi:hypothetical protein